MHGTWPGEGRVEITLQRLVRLRCPHDYDGKWLLSRAFVFRAVPLGGARGIRVANVL
ncbi:hypothetical protein GCM10023328_47560 [Modestobacter marinus]|uniref:Uncharacterized protein n=1 Tax=Modestobacter marinus TaxID=477641 RepID=A0ABQ2GCR6_9ACTN|nr:hypothetical protein GCM10011589_47310 [Modestobacter marinus]